MPRLPILSAFLLLTLTTHACPPQDTTLPPKRGVMVFDSVDVMPKAEFDMNKFLAATINYPDEARENDIQGRVVVRFVVNEDGRVSDAVIMRSPHLLLSEEVLRVLMQMPRWSPGMRDGKPVKVYFTMPVAFSLEGGGRRRRHKKD